LSILTSNFNGMVLTLNNLIIKNQLALEEINLSIIPEEVLNTSLLDLVTDNTVSVRLKHCISAAIMENKLPFITIREYVHYGEKAFFALLKVQNLGRKSAFELHQLIKDLINGNHQLLIKSETQELKLSFNQNSETYTLPIVELVEKSKVSVRLENCIKEAKLNDTLPFQTIGDYLLAGSNAYKRLQKLPNLGKKSALELHTLIHCIVQENQNESFAVDSNAQEDLIMRLSNRNLKDITIDEVLSSLNTRQKEVLELRYGLNFNASLTLEQVGSIFEVTRERIRQVEAKAIRLLRKQYSDWAKNELSSKSQELWGIITKGYLVLPNNPNYSLKKLLSSEVIFLIDIAYTTFSEWLDTISQSSPLGRISLSESLDRIQAIHSEIENNLKTLPLPIHIRTLANIIKISNQDIITTSQLINGISSYGSYISRKAIGKRLKRAFRAHSILVSSKAQSTMTVGELKEIYHKVFHDDPCSTRDLLIVMTKASQLFLNCYEHGWAGLGYADELGSLLKLEDNEPNTENPENEESNDLSFEGASQILKDILKKYGPQKFDNIRNRFISLTNNKFAKSSVGPLLILREDFIRLAPGIYSLRSQLVDELAVEQAEAILLDVKQAELYCHAKFAGEQFLSFPMWTPRMEYLWTKWAKNTNQIQIFQSLLSVATPSVWPISEDEKLIWETLKQKEAFYHFLENNPIELTETIPSTRSVISAAVVAKKFGYLNWMSANRAMGLRVDDRHARSTLALLVAFKVLKPANHWQSKHFYNQDSSELIEKLLQALSEGSSIENLIKSNLVVSNFELGWIRHHDLENLIEAWSKSITVSIDSNDPETSTLESLDDLIKYVQVKMSEEAIYG
jgi:RNA polymerase sigma factor (sigma-70 family)